MNGCSVDIPTLNAAEGKSPNLLTQKKEAGNYKINFNASELTSGIYVDKIRTTGFTSSKKMMLLG